MKATEQQTSLLPQSFGPSQSNSKMLGLEAQPLCRGSPGKHVAAPVVAV
jgi:hypothetical protein